MNTEVYHIEGSNCDIEKLAIAAEILRGGGAVIIPTETTYAVAARGDDVGFEALKALKGSDLSKFCSLHIPDIKALAKYVPNVDMRAAKLVRNFWPGPVTVVFNLSDADVKQQTKLIGKQWAGIYKDNSVSVRCPDNAAVSKLLELAGVPIVATSAKLSGEPAATKFEQAFELFNVKVPFMIDGGQCEEETGSTIVRVSRSSIDVLREGAVESDEIADISAVDIIFVCSSNTCCSPLAAELFKKTLAAKTGCGIDELEMFGYKVRSAGVKVPISQPVRQEALQVADKLGLNLAEHTTTPLAPRDMLCCDLIFAMEQDQRDRILSFYPHLADRCRLLADDCDICDPLDGNNDVYDRFAEILQSCIDEKLGEILI